MSRGPARRGKYAGTVALGRDRTAASPKKRPTPRSPGAGCWEDATLHQVCGLLIKISYGREFRPCEFDLRAASYHRLSMPTTVGAALVAPKLWELFCELGFIDHLGRHLQQPGLSELLGEDLMQPVPDGAGRERVHLN